jgi:hypothetical protein
VDTRTFVFNEVGSVSWTTPNICVQGAHDGSPDHSTLPGTRAPRAREPAEAGHFRSICSSGRVLRGLHIRTPDRKIPTTVAESEWASPTDMVTVLLTCAPIFCARASPTMMAFDALNRSSTCPCCIWLASLETLIHNSQHNHRSAPTTVRTFSSARSFTAIRCSRPSAWRPRRALSAA